MKSAKRGSRRGPLFGFFIFHFAFCICAAGAFGSASTTTLPEIRVDQIGYRADAAKIAAVVSNAKSFAVHRLADGAKVFDGQLSDPVF
ncbi:MAG TPA: cellulase N-terminal Ig-like domain-containing protein, partial [Thermoanaerobaculia bacterium]